MTLAYDWSSRLLLYHQLSAVGVRVVLAIFLICEIQRKINHTQKFSNHEILD